MDLRSLVTVAGVAVMAFTLSISPALLTPASAHAAVSSGTLESVAAANADEDLPGRSERRIVAGVVASKAADSFGLKLRSGRTVTISVNRSTRFVARQRRPVTFADVKPGARVNVMAVQRGGSTLALLVQLMPLARVTSEQHLGEVTALSATSITIHGARTNRDHTARIVADTKVMPVGTTLAVGDRVVALYINDPDSSDPNARIAMRITKIPPPTADTRD